MIHVKKTNGMRSPYPANSMSESVAHIVGNAGDINNLKEGLKQEIVDRKEGDAQLATDIVSIEQTLPIIDEAIANLEDADVRVNSRVDIVVSDLSDEAKARSDADITLQSNIDNEAVRAKQKEDEIAASLANEEKARKDSDSLIQSSLDSESGARVKADDALQSSISSIDSKIPTAASKDNQLADRDWVNSSITTSTSTFRGTVDSLAALKELTGDLNDYAYVEIKDSETRQVIRYDRYKYSDVASEETGNWAFEYTLNNSSFTSDQWKAITSGITSEGVAQISQNKTDIVSSLAEAKKYSDENYQQVFLRYSANSDGSDMTEKWKMGQKYIGTYVAHDASTDYKDYSWTRFVGDTYCIDNKESSVAIELSDESDVSYPNSVGSVSITIPASIYHGFYSGLNFKTGNIPPLVTFDNQSSLSLKLLYRGVTIDSYTPKMNITSQMSFYCDGINVYCYIGEA